MRKVILIFCGLLILLPMIGQGQAIVARTQKGLAQEKNMTFNNLPNAKLYRKKDGSGYVVIGYLGGKRVSYHLPSQAKLSVLHSASSGTLLGATIQPSNTSGGNAQLDAQCKTCCGVSSGSCYDQCVENDGSCPYAYVPTSSIAVSSDGTQVKITP